MKRLYILYLTVCLFAACVKDPDNSPAVADDGRFQLTLQLPRGATPTTYGIDYIRENDILWADILVFHVNAGKEEFAYRQSVTSNEVVNISNLGEQKGISASLKPNPGQDVRLVILANVDPSLLPAVIAEGTEKKDIIDDLMFDLPNGRWHTESTSDWDPIPMWGESDVVQLDPNRNIATIHMLRALAKVHIYLNKYVPVNQWDTSDHGLGIPEFEMKNIYLINGASKAHVVPSAVNYDKQKYCVTAPTIPSPLPTVSSTPIVWPSANGVSAKELINSLYIAETDKLVEGDEDKATYMVLEAEYKGVNTFYRLDFIRYFGGEKVVMDLLRNYDYSFNITTVHREGAPTLQDAMNSLSSNNYLDIELTARSMSVVTNGNYYLTTSTDVVHLLSLDAVSGYQLTIETDDPSGWEATSADPWIQFTSATTGGAGGATLTFDLAAVTEGRTGEITIRTRNMSKTVRVEQTYYTRVPEDYLGYGTPELEVFLDELPFGYQWWDYTNTTYEFTNNNSMNYTYSPEPPFPPFMQESTPVKGSCAALTVGGHTDWRLPTYPELRTIAEYGYDTKNMALYDYWVGWDYVPDGSNWEAHEGNYGNPLGFVSSTYGIASVISHDPSLNREIFESSYSTTVLGLYGKEERPVHAQVYYQGTRLGWDLDWYRNPRSAMRCVRGEKPAHVIPASESTLGYDLYLAQTDIVIVQGDPSNSMFIDRMNHGYTNSHPTSYFNLANLQAGDYDESLSRLSPAHHHSCAKLNENGGWSGFADWRMPTMAELVAIFDYLDDDPYKYVRLRFPLTLIYSENYQDTRFLPYANDHWYSYTYGYLSSETADPGSTKYDISDHTKFVKGLKVVGTFTQVEYDYPNNRKYGSEVAVSKYEDIFMKDGNHYKNEYDDVTGQWTYNYYYDHYTTRCVRN